MDWGALAQAFGTAAIKGAGSFLTGQGAAKQNAQIAATSNQSAIDLANINNAAALERLQMQLAQGDAGAGASRANAALAAKLDRERMLQEAFQNIIRTTMEGRNNQSQSFNTLINASQNAALPR